MPINNLNKIALSGIKLPPISDIFKKKPSPLVGGNGNASNRQTFNTSKYNRNLKTLTVGVGKRKLPNFSDVPLITGYKTIKSPFAGNAPDRVIPQYYNPSVVTSTQAVKQNQVNNTELDKAIAQQQTASLPTLSIDQNNTPVVTSNQNPTPTPVDTQTNPNQKDGATMNENVARAVFGTDLTGLTKNADGSFFADRSALDRISQNKSDTNNNPTTPPTTGVVKSPYQVSLEAENKRMMAEAQALRQRVSSESAALIDGITNEYSQILAQQAIFNKTFEGGTFVEGITSGRNRYAHQQQLGIMAQTVNAGNLAISKITAKRDLVISKAKLARSEGDFKMLHQLMTENRTLIRQEQQAAQTNYSNVFKQAQEVRRQMAEDRQQANADFSQGMSTLTKTGDVLNAAFKQLSSPEEQKAFIESTARGLGLSPSTVAGEFFRIDQKAKAQIGKDVFALSKKYPDASITQLDTVDTAMNKIRQSPSFQRSKNQSEASLALTMKNLNKLTSSEQRTATIADYTNNFRVDSTVNNDLVFGKDGFIKPRYWFEALREAPTRGLSRKDFITTFGKQLIDLSLDPQEIMTKYNISPAELKVLGIIL